MKLQIKDEFTLEVGEDTYQATLCDLTKEQEMLFDKMFSKQKSLTKELGKLFKKISRVERKISIAEQSDSWDEVKKLEGVLDVLLSQSAELADKENDNTAIELMYKKRMEVSIEGDDKEALIKIGETYGYARVFETILQDIRETREKN